MNWEYERVFGGRPSRGSALQSPSPSGPDLNTSNRKNFSQGVGAPTEPLASPFQRLRPPMGLRNSPANASDPPPDASAFSTLVGRHSARRHGQLAFSHVCSPVPGPAAVGFWAPPTEGESTLPGTGLPTRHRRNAEQCSCIGLPRGCIMCGCSGPSLGTANQQRTGRTGRAYLPRASCTKLRRSREKGPRNPGLRPRAGSKSAAQQPLLDARGSEESIR